MAIKHLGQRAQLWCSWGVLGLDDGWIGTAEEALADEHVPVEKLDQPQATAHGENRDIKDSM